MSSKGIFYALGRALRETGQAVDRVGSSWMGNFAFKEQLSRHRRVMPVDNHRPRIGNNDSDVSSDVWIAPNASVAGNVTVDGVGVALFYGANVRASSLSSVRIGRNVVIGDRATVSSNNSNTDIANNAVLHTACTLSDVKSVGENAVIGESAVLLSGTVVGSGAVVEPGSVVAAGTEISANSRWRGNPAVQVGSVSAEEREGLKRAAEQLRELARKHKEEHSKDEAARQKERVFAEFHKTPYSIYKESPF